MHALLDQGQSVWLDYLRRGMTRSGELAAMIADGLRGMTSNPTLFEHAIAGSADYDDACRPSSRGTPRARSRRRAGCGGPWIGLTFAPTIANRNDTAITGEMSVQSRRCATRSAVTR